MALVTEPARADLPPEVLADLLWSTDPELNGFMFQTQDQLHRILGCEWPADRGLMCHRFAFTVMESARVPGLLIGHTAAESEANFEAAKELQTAALGPDEATIMGVALFWMDRLFPAPRARSYYVLELAVSGDAQGDGIASALLAFAEQRARQERCTHISLDVAADSDAVRFYRHLGFEVETRVPFLAEAKGIGPQYHMTRALDRLG